jgi:hypothetical protein
MRDETLAGLLREQPPGLTLIHPGPHYCTCYGFDGSAALARQNGLRPNEDYADCWRGLLLCVGDPPPRARRGSRLPR